MLEILMAIIKTLILLGILVIIHEGGHFVVAKLCKVKVNEFSIGFGKILLSRQKGETKYCLRLIPLGGFVSMEGEEEHSDAEGSFSNASILKKITIVSAGAIVNILFGLLVYFLLITFHYGIEIAAKSTINYIGALGDSIRILFTGGTTIDDLAGPVGVATIVSQTSSLTDFIYLLSVISLSLGITNLIPIPPLDGGKILIYIIEFIKRKPLKEETSLKIQMAGFMFIIGLSVFVMYNDVARIL